MTNQRNIATQITTILTDAGYEALFAGGCVRDKILGIEPKDYDIATNATPEQVLSLFPDGDSVGKNFGVIIVKLENINFEIATFRSDGSYSDNRRPDTVEFTNAEEDAKRRDFTINALFENPSTGEIIDFVGGLEDINNGVIRCVGDPNKRFEEDALRMFRAVRFESVLKGYRFILDDSVIKAIDLNAFRCKNIAKERISIEVRKILDSSSPNTLYRLHKTGMIECDSITPINIQKLKQKRLYC